MGMCTRCTGKGCYEGDRGGICADCDGTGLDIYTSSTTTISQADLILDLSDKEMAALEDLAKQNDMSKSAIIRQALRLYQLVTERQKTHDMVWKDHRTGHINSSIVDLPPKMSGTS